jgi:peptidoglycan/LPS O-acetylase OafA/YrhL
MACVRLQYFSVIGNHAFPAWVPGGFVGVDVFFVISGYLISSIIFSNLDSDRFSYVEFYFRRIKRIFPSLILVIFVTYVFGWYVLLLDEFEQLGSHVLSAAVFVSNITLWSESGYFESDSKYMPLLHLWSLGVEEQFYILWPLMLGFVWNKRYHFLFATLAIAVASYAANIYLIDEDPSAAFYLPFGRMWELMVGGILAYVVMYKSFLIPDNPYLLRAFSVSGLLIVFSSILLLDEYLKFPGVYALFPVVGTFLIIAAGFKSWVNYNLLSNRLIVYVGLISYPLYLWHWPLLSYAHILEAGTPDRFIRIGVVLTSFLLSWLTYILLEKRFKSKCTLSSIVMLSGLMFIVFIVGSMSSIGVILPRNSSDIINKAVVASNDWYWPGDLQPIETRDITPSTVYTKEASRRITLFVGDSVMQQYSPRIVKLLT